MEVLKSHGVTLYKMDLRIYDKFGVIESLFNSVEVCFRFVDTFSNNDIMYRDTYIRMETLKKELTELEEISPEVDLRDFAKCGLRFLRTLTRLFENPGYDICLLDVVAWYDNVKYRRVRTLRDKKEGGPF